MTQQEAIRKLNIQVDLIPAGASNRPGTRIRPRFVTIHNTANTDPGADAAMHARYVKGPDARAREVSWHFTVDDRQCFKHLPTNEKGWHAGPGNSQSIGIEVCENRGIDKTTAIDRAALMMLAYDIPGERVVPHRHWTGKDCPRVILRESGGFDAFRDRAAAYLAELQAPAPVTREAAFARAGDAGTDYEPAEEEFADDALSMLAESVEADLETTAGGAFVRSAPIGDAERIAQLERLVVQLSLENFNLRQALESGADDASREAD